MTKSVWSFGCLLIEKPLAFVLVIKFTSFKSFNGLSGVSDKGIVFPNGFFGVVCNGWISPKVFSVDGISLIILPKCLFGVDCNSFILPNVFLGVGDISITSPNLFVGVGCKSFV